MTEYTRQDVYQLLKHAESVLHKEMGRGDLTDEESVRTEYSVRLISEIANTQMDNRKLRVSGDGKISLGEDYRYSDGNYGCQSSDGQQAMEDEARKYVALSLRRIAVGVEENRVLDFDLSWKDGTPMKIQFTKRPRTASKPSESKSDD